MAGRDNFFCWDDKELPLDGCTQVVETDGLENRLRYLLNNHQYRSMVTGQNRSMMSHHVDALVKTLLPFIREESQGFVPGELVVGESDLLGITMEDADSLRTLREMLSEQAKDMARQRRAGYNKWPRMIGESSCRKYARILESIAGTEVTV